MTAKQAKQKPAMENRPSRYKRVVFEEDQIIESYRLEDLLKARDNGEELCHWQPFLEWEEYLLTRWKQWFTFKTVPWAVTFTNGKCYLWKIDEEDPELRIQDRPSVNRRAQTQKRKKIKKTCLNCHKEYKDFPAGYAELGDAGANLKFGLCEVCSRHETPEPQDHPVEEFLKKNRPVRGM